METYDGDSILYFSVPQDTNSGVFRQPTNGTHRITLGAIAESGPVPCQCFGDGAECVWLAYASGCYFRGNSNLLGISLETLNTSLGDFKRFDVPIRHLDYSVSPYLPEAVDYTVTNFEYLGPDGAILERSLPKPFEHGYTRATFRTGTFTNLGDFAFPASFEYTQFMPEPDAKTTSDLRKTIVIRGYATNITIGSFKLSDPRKGLTLTVKICLYPKRQLFIHSMKETRCPLLAIL